MTSAPHSRHAVITGANTGIGFITARELARQGVRVTLAGRSAEKYTRAIEGIREAAHDAVIEFVQLDLADLDSVRACAGALHAGPQIDLLVNNAGLGGIRGTTKQGFELAFGTNHLGHYLLTRLLIDQLAPGARVINVSSRQHRSAKRPRWDRVVGDTRSFTGLPEYAVSKLANVLFTSELARRHGAARLRACSLHPGRVATDIFRRMPRPLLALTKIVRPMITPEQGAATTLHCATANADDIPHGAYFSDCRVTDPSRLATDSDLARELWERSADWVELPKS
jgi:NAD(P)-dependent dehydrogenase (short-subunit alcohol dehydrogenase family)